MLIEQMSSNEIREQLLKDAELSCGVFQRLGCKFMKRVSKIISRHKTYYSKFKWVSPKSKQDYLCIMNIKSDYKKKGLGFVQFAKLKYGMIKNYNYIRLADDGVLALTFHCVKRYAERNLNICDIFDDDEIMFRLYQDNGSSVTIYKDGNKFVDAMSSGLMFGSVDDGIKVWKTYVSIDMLKKSQLDAINEILNIIPMVDEFEEYCAFNQITDEDRLQEISKKFDVQRSLASQIYNKFFENC